MLDWMDQFRFDSPLTVVSDQSPIIVDVDQGALDFCDEEAEDED